MRTLYILLSQLIACYLFQTLASIGYCVTHSMAISLQLLHALCITLYIYIMMVFTIHRFFSRWYYADDTKSIAVNRKWKWKKKHNSLKMVTNEEKKWIKTNKFALFCVAIHNANIIESVLVVWYGMVCYFTLNRIQWQTKCERIYKIVL